ncbi:MAG: 5-(carboxyamino)imidazole ribonucleotide synthase [Janthinobacterium lividum]
MNQSILPGATLGILGSGQLGRMFTLSARSLGYRVHTFSPDTDTPTGQVADLEVAAAYDDLEAVREFARAVDVVTFEFENVPAETAAAVAAIVPVRPGGSVLHIAQNRKREKEFLSSHGFPCAPFRLVTSLNELEAALKTIGTPSILKTAGFGYDGKGQVRLKNASEAADAWTALGGSECVLEGFIDFEREISVVAARGLDGSFAHYGAIENAHKDGILDISVCPLPHIEPNTAAQAVEITQAICEVLNVVGVLCVEFFVTTDGSLIVNEMAPRPHNSGHLTIEAHATSQFEQQVRAVCGLPLGSTQLLRPAAMANLLGEVWENGTPDWVSALAIPNVALHLYGKEQARPGRKMGHLTALAETPQVASELVRAARAALTFPTRVTSITRHSA